MKKIVCQLTICDVVTTYCVDQNGILYTPQNVRSGFDLRPVNGHRKSGNVVCYPIKRMNLDLINDNNLLSKKTTSVDSKFFKQFFNPSLAVELDIDCVEVIPNPKSMRPLFVNEKITTTGIDDKGYLYCFKKGKSCPIIPNYMDGVQYYTLSMIEDGMVFDLPFVQRFGKGNVIKVSDLKEYFSTQVSLGLPSDYKEQSDTQKMKLLAPKITPSMQKSCETKNWFEVLPDNVELLIKTSPNGVKLFDNKQHLKSYLSSYPIEELTEIQVYMLAGNVMVAPPSKVNELVF